MGYRDGRAVGWVSLGPRQDYERLTHSRVLAPVDERPVWSIVCFVVSAKARRRGVGTGLLAAAIGYAREHGARMLEAYPLDASRGRVSGADAYGGTQGMFERAGFTVVDVRRANATAPPRPIVRLDLVSADARRDPPSSVDTGQPPGLDSAPGEQPARRVQLRGAVSE